MNWRKLNRVLHRDIGYIFFGMTIIYALSGIALNHLKDWNPSYMINREVIEFNSSIDKSYFNDDYAKSVLKNHKINEKYKSFYFPSESDLTIFFEDGSLNVNLNSRKGIIESVKRRPIFFEVNLLHYNPGWMWKWFSDIYAVGLIVIAITGLFILKGKQGLKGRGGWLTSIGIIVPLIFLFFYL